MKEVKSMKGKSCHRKNCKMENCVKEKHEWKTRNGKTGSGKTVSSGFGSPAIWATFYGVATLAEFTQKVPRNGIKFWALSGLFTQQKVLRILKKCKQTRQGPEFK